MDKDLEKESHGIFYGTIQKYCQNCTYPHLSQYNFD